MRDDQRGTFTADRANLGLNRFFALGIERRRGLVEHEDRRVLEQGARDGDSLLFATGQFESPLADRRLQSLRQFFDKFIEPRCANHRVELLIGRCRKAVTQIEFKRVVE